VGEGKQMGLSCCAKSCLAGGLCGHPGAPSPSPSQGLVWGFTGEVPNRKMSRDKLCLFLKISFEMAWREQSCLLQ